MKKIAALVAALLLVSTAAYAVVVGYSRSGGGDLSYPVLYDFEETGTPTGITVSSGTINFDAAGIDGESLSLSAHTDAEDKIVYYSVTHTNNTMLWTRLKVKFSYFLTVENTTDLIVFKNNSLIYAYFGVTKVGGSVYFSTQAYNGTRVLTSDPISLNTEYIVDVGYMQGTGTNAVSAIAFSTSGEPSRSGSKYAESTNGTRTNTINRIDLGSSTSYTNPLNGYDCLIDNVSYPWEE